jgi:hypothetical protein
MEILDEKKKALRDNYDEAKKGGETASFPRWIQLSSESDPAFFRWLTGDNSLDDFECSEDFDFESFLIEIARDELRGTKYEDYVIFVVNNEDRNMVIGKESWFETEYVCEAYDNHGQVCGCDNAGCYILENTESSFAMDAIDNLLDELSIGEALSIKELSEELGSYAAVKYLIDEDERCIFVDTELSEPLLERASAFLLKWIEENEHHAEHKAYTFWNGHNHETVVLEGEFEESDIERLDDELEELLIVLDYKESDGWYDSYNGCSPTGYKYALGHDYDFSVSSWQGDWEIASIIEKK